MKRLKLILAVESYLVRRGIGVVLKSFPDITVVKEFDTIQQLEQYMKLHSSDFLIICDSLFNYSRESGHH